MPARSKLRWWCCVLVGGTAGGASAAAPVTFDGSLGPRASRSGADMIVPASHGRIVGRNLFHSFGRLDVPEASTMRFQGPERVGNVIARVTGGRASRINGTLACEIPNANLFLLNPTGVIFGPGVRVDVDGSFVVSTAHELKLADGGTFSAVNPADDLLTTAAPEAFGFLRSAPVSGVYVDQSTLTLATGKPHAVVAGEVRISGGKLLAPAGKISVVSVGGAGSVTGGLTPRIGAAVPRADVSLTQGAQLSVASESGGSVAIEARHLDVDLSTISARTSVADSTGDIDINLTGDLTLRGGRIETGTDGPGEGGSVNLAADTVELIGVDSPLQLGIETASGSRLTTRGPQIRGRAGDVRVKAETLRILDGAAIDASTHTRGRGGDISVTVAGDAYFANEAFILKAPPETVVDRIEWQARDTGIIARTYGHFAGSGSSGDVHLEARNLTLHTSGVVTSTTRGLGDAGDVRVSVSNHVAISSPRNEPKVRESSGGILAQTLPESDLSPDAGNGGNAIVRAGSINLQSEDVAAGAVIAAASRGNGRAGSVLVEAGEVTLRGEGALVHALSLGTLAFPGAEVNGSAGSATLRVKSLRVLGGGVSVKTETLGPAGNLNITADRIEVADGGQITTESTRSGATGTMTLRVREDLLVRDGNITAKAVAADGGNILLFAPRFLLQGAILQADAENGSGGNLSLISLPQQGDAILSTTGKTQLLANSLTGRGGNITIITPRIDLGDAEVNASGSLATDVGTVDIATAQTDLVGSLVPLRTTLSSPFARLHDCCESVIGRDLSSFVQVGRGGLPLDPGSWSPMNVPPARGPSRGNTKP